MVVISAQNATVFNFRQNRFPSVRTPNHAAYGPPFLLAVKVVKRKHVRVIYFAAFPFTFPGLHVLVKEPTVSVSSLTIPFCVGFFVCEVIVVVVSLFIKGHRGED